MPMSHYDHLDLRFLNHLHQFEKLLTAHGIRFEMICGFRSIADQDELYAFGRTEHGRILTDARGGESFHNYGLAADYILHHQADSTKPYPWALFGVLAKSVGLRWGGDFIPLRDYGHVELDVPLPRKSKKKK